ncbi:Glycosyl hydrolases family 2, TIM barrel domain [Chitinophaga sp. YR627]|uniref:glycoside hydrolase family 2 protein n=1 Tax=Chitinophaga sp. YR627 TaxID=1881041 RepID=UPI0008EB5673|nr:sugar-binding domain-containing protein [Chitinophaga sp. YR627]SFO26029.1 Glycosyl hydrolases family 2, TIM barrel domain [Chitinophaga sp. YR627]
MKPFKSTLLFVTLCFPYFQIALAIGEGDRFSGHWAMKQVPVQTQWATAVSPDNVLPEYPRPQMVRSQWQNLNGLWEYAITHWDAGMPDKFDGEILVPFAIESALSGVQKQLLPTQRLWYRRHIRKPDTHGGKRVLLHFGAVDWRAAVFLNGKLLGRHMGGYQHFSFDITASLQEGDNELVVTVLDPSNLGPNPCGKQSLRPRKILYTAVSGIWQTVWLETVPPTYITDLYSTPDIDAHCLNLRVNTSDTTGVTVDVTAYAGAVVAGHTQGRAGRMLDLGVPFTRLWSPANPFLYHMTIRLLKDGHVIDSVNSYFGMRKIKVQPDSSGMPRLFLNNKYTFHLGVLDQGYWPEGLYTAPTDAALLYDIVAIKNMGFNTIRKHVKLEPDRWYYYADSLGMLVWQDMVPCADADYYATSQFEQENAENLRQLHHFPSIVMWILFNEGWGKYNQQTLTEWMKQSDPSRIINGHSGENLDEYSDTPVRDRWISSDVADVHYYPGPYIAPALPGKARVLGEWGGVRVPTPGHQWAPATSWGYIQVTADRFAQRYAYMMERLKKYEQQGLSGAIYTQPYDVESEENGFMTYDRKVVKIKPEEMRKVNQILTHQTAGR